MPDGYLTGQQELYAALRGTSGPDGLRVLCIGGVPGGVYEPPEWTA